MRLNDLIKQLRLISLNGNDHPAMHTAANLLSDHTGGCQITQAKPESSQEKAFSLEINHTLDSTEWASAPPFFYLPQIECRWRRPAYRLAPAPAGWFCPISPL